MRKPKVCISFARFMCILVLCLTQVVLVSAQQSNPIKLDSGSFGAVEARSIGPATMSGRISYIDGVNSNPLILYVGTASGGVWKTVNGGTTFQPIFDKQAFSIGAIAIDQSKPDTVWVGTGESWVRNSVSVGAGLYKSTDAGETWQMVGLEKTERIGKIVIDPKNPDVVYVAALGHLWDGNEDRGLYKTTDGGKTWTKILYVNADTGCSDVAIDPQEPSIVYAGMWQFRRYPWSFNSGGPGSGLHKSTDGGKTWAKLTKGLPEGDLGRIALAVAKNRPNMVYACVEAKKTGLYRSDNLGETWELTNSSFTTSVRPFYFSHLVADPKDYKVVYKAGLIMAVSKDSGKSFTNLGGSSHGDQHTIWVDPTNTSHLYVGTDGGVYESRDGGRSYNFLRNLPVSQFYHVTYDLEAPYNVYGGLQDNGTWVGPSRSPGGIQIKDWDSIGFGDGFWVFPDPADASLVYVESQGGGLQRLYRKTGEFKDIKPRPEAGDPELRFNWNTPIEVGAKNQKQLFIGSQFLFQSTDRGESWQKISPDLTTNNPEKLKQEQSGGLTIDNSTAENHCTIYSISSSPVDENVIWVGTDDGNVQVTRDDGKTWANVTQNIPNLPKNTWVSCVEASHHAAGTAYATFDGHNTGDMKAWVYQTTDFGQTWKPIMTDDIKGYAHVVREDLVNPNLLFVGTEFGLFISVTGGSQWAPLTGKFPAVAVRDLSIHPRESDLLIATHGRGIYIVDDITPLRKLTNDVLNSEVVVLDGRPSVMRFGGAIQEFPGDDEFAGANATDSAIITYYLRERHVVGDFKVEVFDPQGKLVSTLPGSKRRGINRVEWPMRLKPPKAIPSSAALGGTPPGAFVGPIAPEGTYTVKITKGQKTFDGKFQLVPDPGSPHSAEDRKLQNETARKLYTLQEDLGYLVATIADTRKQIQDRATKAREPKTKDGEALAKSLDALAEKLQTQYKKLVATRDDLGYIGGEEQLRERLIGLYGSINGYSGRPTKSQLDYAGVLEKEFTKSGQDFEALVTTEVNAINSKLQVKKLDPLKVQSREEYDKAQSGR